MASVKIRYEQLNLTDSLQSYLNTAGYSGIVVKGGFQSDQTIVNPMAAITFLPTEGQSLQLGKISGKDKWFLRRVQIDAYMENEPRQQTIIDDIMDFFLENFYILIKDPQGNELGYMITTRDDTVTGNAVPPNLTQPKLIRFRGIVRADLESFYPG